MSNVSKNSRNHWRNYHDDDDIEDYTALASTRYDENSDEDYPYNDDVDDDT